MKYTRLNTLGKVAGIAVACFVNSLSAQSLQEGMMAVDAAKYVKAKENFNAMLASGQSAENYFYLGNTYLSQYNPDFDKATEYFNKGLAAKSNSYLNQIGLAAIKLAKYDRSAIQDLVNIAQASRERDHEVLYRVGEALVMFEKHSDPKSEVKNYDAATAITYLDKAIQKAQEKGKVPTAYYYTLGDAYRILRNPGPAMTAYEKAATSGGARAAVLTRMGTLWMAAQQWQKGKENIDQAISLDPTYAPAYRALSDYYRIYQQYDQASEALQKYSQYADNDPNTNLELSNLYFISGDNARSLEMLNRAFEQIQSNEKYKLRAFTLYETGDYAGAKADLETYFSKTPQKDLKPSDMGLQGLILAGLAYKEPNDTTRDTMLGVAMEKINPVKSIDKTFNYEAELGKLAMGKAEIKAAALNEKSNPTIDAAKLKVKENPQDTGALFELANAHQAADNWNSAALIWDQMVGMLPEWESGYSGRGFALQKLGKNEAAISSYKKFLELANAKSQEQKNVLKDAMLGVYYNLASLQKEKDKETAISTIEEGLSLSPGDANLTTLLKSIK